MRPGYEAPKERNEVPCTDGVVPLPMHPLGFLQII